MYIEGDVPVVTTGGNGNNGNGLMNGDGIWAIILFALIFGRNGYGGFGGFGGGGGGVGENYILATDFATIERKLDSISNGICDATFALNNNLTQGFAGLNTALITQGYETRLGTQALAGQLAQCCCDLKQGIGETNYNVATQSNMLARGIENGFAQTNYNLATQNCATLQAIDKVGDRVIDYLTQGELRKYRDDALVARFRQEVNPCAIPAYPVPNPNCCYPANVTFGNPYGNSCGCC